MFVSQDTPDENKKRKQVQHSRVPKPAKVVATTKKVDFNENRGKSKRGVRVVKTVAEEDQEDFGRTESQ